MGKYHPDTIESTTNLATIFFNQERWTEAKKKGLCAFQRAIEVLTTTHKVVLESLDLLISIVMAYRKQQRWADAAQLSYRLLEVIHWQCRKLVERDSLRELGELTLVGVVPLILTVIEDRQKGRT